MDNKTFISRLADAAGIDIQQAQSLTDALAEAIRRNCGNLDTVALPGFGSFVPEKHDERVVTDESTGKRLMLPPEVVLTFKAGSMLKKHLENE